MKSGFLLSRREGLAGLALSAVSAPGFAKAKPKIRILAFGASNTWGFQPVDAKERVLRRLSFDERWTGVAQRSLGADFEIVEDALPGRTAGVDRPTTQAGSSLPGSAFNGLTELPEALARNIPLSLVVLQLGTNDLMLDATLSADALVERIAVLCRTIARFAPPIPLANQGKPMRALVMAPTGIGPMANNSNWQQAEATRIKAWPELQAAGLKDGFSVFDGASAVPSPGIDGLHFGAEAHRKLGRLAAVAIRRVLSD